MIDTHCHLDDSQFNESRSNIIANLREDGLSKIITVGCDMESSYKAMELANSNADIYFAVAVHPENAEQWKDSNYQELLELSTHPKCVAIGETGLDYHYEGFNKETQIEVFRKHIELASQAQLPYIVHCRDAYKDCQDVMAECMKYKFYGAQIHCFSGSAEWADIMLKMGCYISFTGSVTFKNNKTGPKVIQGTPMDRILVETDSPYLSPVPLRGKMNQPKNVYWVIDFISKIKQKTFEEVEQATQNNACKLFTKLNYKDIK